MNSRHGGGEGNSNWAHGWGKGLKLLPFTIHAPENTNLLQMVPFTNVNDKALGDADTSLRNEILGKQYRERFSSSSTYVSSVHLRSSPK